MSQSELLLPAGSFDHVRYALAYGADAVYAGQPRYSLRVRNNDFSQPSEIKKAIDYCHAQGKRFYLVVNIAPHNSKIHTFLDDMAKVIELNPDALIMSDPGLIMMVRDEWPDVPIHLSVQANTVNFKAVEFWQRQGISRVILSRELSLDEISDIREQCPEMELEVFVHGALCIAYSGRCLLSGYMNRRDPNQGTCTNACRWDYQVVEAKEDATGDLIAKSQGSVALAEPALIADRNKPDELMPVDEDEHGTYIMNSKDLRAIEHVERLLGMGVHSLKVEGRTKSVFYVARVTQAYRKAIDLAAKGQLFDPALLYQLDSLANRGYTDGFLQRHKPQQLQNYEQGYSLPTQQQYVGQALDVLDGGLLIDVKNRFAVGDEMELMLPSGNHRFILQELSDRQAQSIAVAKGSGHQVLLPLPFDIEPEEVPVALLLKTLG
ncbi:MAG: tRNA 5-hydroxyuridine modification protein YegQ [Cellvibrionales bacterium]|nr:tRNA 5-hydroxyuridine modification protein YegQ [Cellvibrionales bacterium]